MKLSEMKTSDELLAEQLRDDPEFRAEWERQRRLPRPRLGGVRRLRRELTVHPWLRHHVKTQVAWRLARWLRLL